MNSPDHQLHRLLSAARRGMTALPAEEPFGFSGRVLAIARASGGAEISSYRLIMRALGVAFAVAILSVGSSYTGIRDFLDAKSTPASEARFADSAISLAITR